MSEQNSSTSTTDTTNVNVDQTTTTNQTTTEPTQTPPTPPSEAAKPNTQVVPENYTLDLGKDAVLDNTYLDSFKSYAKEQKLTQEQASQLLNRENFAVSEYVKKQNADFESIKNNWVETVKKDPEIGGEHYAANVELAHRALEKYGTPQFKQELEESGYGNHPELVRIFARIGKSMQDDKFVSPNAVTGGKKSYEEIFYGN